MLIFFILINILLQAGEDYSVSIKTKCMIIVHVKSL